MIIVTKIFHWEIFLTRVMIPGILVLGISLLLITSPINAREVPTPKTYIGHKQSTSFGGESFLSLEVTVKDPAGIKEVRCYFRFDTSSPFIFSEMKHTRKEVFSTKLPVPLSTTNTIEYLFLVVNERRQVIISPNYFLERNREDGISSEIVNNDFYQYDFKSEVTAIDSVKKYFIEPDHIIISSVSLQKSYGIIAGLYLPEQIDYEVAAGYFGAFRFDSTLEMIAVKGYMILGRSRNISTMSQPDRLSKDPSEYEEDSVFPNIAGSNWTGFFWRSDKRSSSLVSITAEVTQDEEGWVTITTSKEDLGHYLVGRMNSAGFIFLYDQYDGEDWTTHYEPASDLHITIADYIHPPTIEDPDPPLNIIEIERSEIEKEVPRIFPIFMLLLSEPSF